MYDVEVSPDNWNEFLLVGFYDGENYYSFKSLDEFLNHVLTRKYWNWRFFAHYGGRFDIHYVYDHLRKYEQETFHVDITCIGSCVISLQLREKFSRGTWRFVDSFRLLPRSLKTLTNEFNVTHKKLDFTEAFTSARKLRKYNEYDCRGLYEVLEEFFGIFELCSETLPSHAMRVFRAYFQKQSLYQLETKVENFIRKCYFGGRVELFRYDAAQVSDYDVNSMYPYAMLQPVPVEYLFYSRRRVKADEIGFYRVAIEYPDTYLPVLPVLRDKLYFPVGRYEAFISSMEMEAAEEQGAKVTILDGCIFRSDTLLAEYADSLYTRKVEAERSGNKGIRYCMKIMLNGFYGKFGQRREQVTYVFDDGRPGIYPILDSGEETGIGYVISESNARHILPHISACITSRSRLILYDYLRQCKRIWYCDTDSIMTDSKLETSDKLGGLKLEKQGEFQGYRSKEYRFDGKLKIKGMPKRCSKCSKKICKCGSKGVAELEHDQKLCEAFLAGEKIYFKRMAGMRESIRGNKEAVRKIEVSKTRSETRGKRKRVGNDTEPWNYAELV